MNEKDITPDKPIEAPDGDRTSLDTRTAVHENLSAQETRKLTPEQQAELLSAFETRFNKTPEHYERPDGVSFSEVRKALEANPALMYSLAQMENTGGMPDVIDIQAGAFVFGDCSAESPHHNLTYDQAAEMAKEFGVDMMPEEVYRAMQKSGKFDIKTWSWLATPADIREVSYASLGDRIDGVVYVDLYGAELHFPDKGWRGVLRVPRV